MVEFKSLTSLTEIERVWQLQRMNSYPPQAFRLANWLEARPESLIFYRLQEKFFSAIDIAPLGENPHNLLFLPLVLFCLYFLIKNFRR